MIVKYRDLYGWTRWLEGTELTLYGRVAKTEKAGSGWDLVTDKDVHTGIDGLKEPTIGSYVYHLYQFQNAGTARTFCSLEEVEVS